MIREAEAGPHLVEFGPGGVQTGPNPGKAARCRAWASFSRIHFSMCLERVHRERSNTDTDAYRRKARISVSMLFLRLAGQEENLRVDRNSCPCRSEMWIRTFVQTSALRATPVAAWGLLARTWATLGPICAARRGLFSARVRAFLTRRSSLSTTWCAAPSCTDRLVAVCCTSSGCVRALFLCCTFVVLAVCRCCTGIVLVLSWCCRPYARLCGAGAGGGALVT